VTRKEFTDAAKPLELSINGKKVVVNPKQFSTGSFGWYLNEKMTLTVGDKAVTVQLGLNFTVVGSKELPPQA